MDEKAGRCQMLDEEYERKDQSVKLARYCIVKISEKVIVAIEDMLKIGEEDNRKGGCGELRRC